ncbi:ATP-grasp domain-containing protein [Streptomyces sp. NPDC020996]|uniref:preATP grasp domain-containing protein n=1 Tax=Streptomyces sp. NPDC020996 TaxID=3154791 RepID=UPI0033CB7C55
MAPDTSDGVVHGPGARPGFVRRLKAAVTGDPDARFVHLNNFEVERVWGEGEPGLPGAGLSLNSPTVNRMEEVGVLLVDEGDAVILKEAVEPALEEYLRGLGLAAGRVLTVDRNTPERSVAVDALDSPRLLAELASMADGRTHLMPMGVSVHEERLAAATGLPLAGPSAAVCKHVNGKLFSRALVDRSGLRQVPGTGCRTVDELAAAIEEHLADGAGPVVVKESLGVSGRGLVVLDSARRGERLVRMAARRGARLDVVVERWIDKECDLNYQFLVGRDGSVSFETVKAALTENGVHRGHLFPPPLTPAQTAELETAAQTLGKGLAEAGYFGVVGVDAMLGRDGTLYPCLEINARFNMATFQNRLAERFVLPGRHALATVFDLQPRRVHGFAEVREALGGLLFAPGAAACPERARGVLVSNTATLRAGAAPGRPFPGRLYAVCVGDGPQDVNALRSAAARALEKMVEQA